MSYSNYVLNQRLSNIEYQLQHGTPSTSTLEDVLMNGNSAGGLSITDVSNINVTTINGSVPAGGDVFLAGGTSTTPQEFTGYNKFDNSVDLPSIRGSGIEILFPVSIPSGVQVGAGLAVLWNQDDAIVHYGETDFLNYAQDGTGGFVFWNTSTQSAPNIIAKILPSVSPTSNDSTLASTAFVQSAISPLAPLASPAFTGTPTAPTATTGDNSTNIATTAFVYSAINSALYPLSGSIAIDTGYSGTVSYYLLFSFGGQVGTFAGPLTGAGQINFVNSAYNSGNEQQVFTFIVDIPSTGMISGISYPGTYTMTSDTYNWSTGKVGQPTSCYAIYTADSGCFFYLKWATNLSGVSSILGGFSGTTFNCTGFPTDSKGLFTFTST